MQTEQVRIVQGPAEQADAVVATIAGYEGRYRADQIVVGVLDEQLVPHLLHRLQQAQLPARWVVGKTLRETAPYRLLEALAQRHPPGTVCRLRGARAASGCHHLVGVAGGHRGIGSLLG